MVISLKEEKFSIMNKWSLTERSGHLPEAVALRFTVC